MICLFTVTLWSAHILITPFYFTTLYDQAISTFSLILKATIILCTDNFGNKGLCQNAYVAEYLKQIYRCVHC